MRENAAREIDSDESDDVICSGIGEYRELSGGGEELGEKKLRRVCYLIFTDN